MPCHPTCPGFGVFNVPDDSADDVTGGEIQRCDACGTFATDDDVEGVFSALGCVTRKGVITYVPTRAYAPLRLLGCAPPQPRPIRMART